MGKDVPLGSWNSITSPLIDFAPGDLASILAKAGPGLVSKVAIVAILPCVLLLLRLLVPERAFPSRPSSVKLLHFLVGSLGILKMSTFERVSIVHWKEGSFNWAYLAIPQIQAFGPEWLWSRECSVFVRRVRRGCGLCRDRTGGLCRTTWCS